MVRPGSNIGINLSAISYKENGTWIAHCLELDIVAEGEDADDAIRVLIALCDMQIRVAIEEGDLPSIFRPAPPEVWQMFTAGREKLVTDKKHPGRKVHFRAPVDRFEARELALA